MLFHICIFITILGLLSFMTWYDLKNQIILHRFLIGFWVLLSLAYQQEILEKIEHLEIFLNIFLVFLPLFSFNLFELKIGMGDVKYALLLSFYFPFYVLSILFLLSFFTFIIFYLLYKNPKMPFLPFFNPFLMLYFLYLFTH